MQNSGGATQMQPDVMQEMTTELSEKWQQILIDSNLAKLRTEMSEEDLRDHVVALLPHQRRGNVETLEATKNQGRIVRVNMNF